MIDLERAKTCKIKRANTDWWINEKAVVAQNGKTYIGYVTDVGEIHIKEFDAKCSKAESRDVCLCRLNADYSDEHNAPSVCVLHDGRILVTYTGHGTHPVLRYRRTEKPFDIYSFGEEKELCYQGGVTYVQLFENTKRNEIWLFSRVDKVNWEFRYSADQGDTWSSPRRFLHSEDGGLFYFNVRKQIVKTESGPGEQWFFALYGHPRISRDHNIRSGIFRDDGRLLRTDGTETDFSLFGRDEKVIDLAGLDVVYASPEGTTVRLLDVAATLPLRVGFAPFVLDREYAPNPDSAAYYSATFRDGKWEISEKICSAGEFLAKDTKDGSQTYLGGMAYYYGVGEEGLHRNSNPFGVTTNRVYIARFDGKDRVLESYLSRDFGKKYVLEEEICRIPGYKEVKIWRPVVPVFAQDNMPVYWHEGTYAAHSGGWHSDVVMRVEYDD